MVYQPTQRLIKCYYRLSIFVDSDYYKRDHITDFKKKKKRKKNVNLC